MSAYDSSAYHPPAPVALVTVRSPMTGATVADVPMLIDTGADISILPSAAVSELVDPLVAQTNFELQGFDGTTTSLPAATLEIEFLGKAFRGQFLLLAGTSGILGRNVLNALPLLFDEPALTWKEYR